MVKKWQTIIIASILMCMAITSVRLGRTNERTDKFATGSPEIDHRSPDPAPSSTRGLHWVNKIVDSEGEVGSYTSLGLDSGDLPHISYRDFTHKDLKYTRYDGEQWLFETVDSGGDVGLWTSIALSSSDEPHISYYDSSNQDLKYVYKKGIKWINTTVNSTGSVGQYSSLALDSGDNPHISYYDQTNGNLEYTYYDGAKWHNTTVDAYGDVGSYTSIALDSADRPHISYLQKYSYPPPQYFVLGYAYFDGAQWHNDTVDDTRGVGIFSDIALDSSDRPHISYRDGNPDGYLKYTYFNGSSWHDGRVDSVGDVGRYTSIALNSSDRPHISYFDDTAKDAKYIYHDGSRWYKETIDSGGETGRYTSLVIDSDDTAHVSYCRGWHGELKYAVRDLTLPVLEVDNSPPFGTTGDYFNFNISASDDHNVTGVSVNWAQSYLGDNLSLTGSDGHWIGRGRLGDMLINLTYIVYIKDAANNVYVSEEIIKEVKDNDPPSVREDNSDVIGTTGEDSLVSVKVLDNIEVEEVRVNWSHGSVSGNGSLVSSGDNWVTNISTDSGSVDNLTYVICVKDTSDNWFASPVVNVTVLDDDKPHSYNLTGKEEPRTGESFNLSIAAYDNVGVQEVSVRYSFTDVTFQKVSMETAEPGDGENWTVELETPRFAEAFNYSLSISDAAENTLDTGYSVIPVTDDISPELVKDETIGVPSTGEDFEVNIRAGDNIGVESVKIRYSFDEENYFERSLSNYDNEMWGAEVNVSESALFLIYSFNISDADGNFIITPEKNLSVLDNDPPAADAGEDMGFEEGAQVTLDGSGSSDNVGVINWTWELEYNGTTVRLYGTKPTMFFDIPGKYEVELEVRDAAKGSDEDSVMVEIWDVTDPEAKIKLDGELIESGLKYSYKEGDTVTLDAGESRDNSRIENYKWTMTRQGVTGEGDTLVGRNREYTFESPGVYTIELLVTDSGDNTHTASFEVEVEGVEEEKPFPVFIVVIVVVIVVLLGLVGVLIWVMKKGKGEVEEEIVIERIPRAGEEDEERKTPPMYLETSEREPPQPPRTGPPGPPGPPPASARMVPGHSGAGTGTEAEDMVDFGISSAPPGTGGIEGDGTGSALPPTPPGTSPGPSGSVGEQPGFGKPLAASRTGTAGGEGEAAPSPAPGTGEGAAEGPAAGAPAMAQSGEGTGTGEDSGGTPEQPPTGGDPGGTPEQPPTVGDPGGATEQPPTGGDPGGATEQPPTVGDSGGAAHQLPQSGGDQGAAPTLPSKAKGSPGTGEGDTEETRESGT